MWQRVAVCGFPPCVTAIIISGASLRQPVLNRVELRALRLIRLTLPRWLFIPDTMLHHLVSLWLLLCTLQTDQVGASPRLPLSSITASSSLVCDVFCGRESGNGSPRRVVKKGRRLSWCLVLSETWIEKWKNNKNGFLYIPLSVSEHVLDTSRVTVGYVELALKTLEYFPF